MPMAIPLNPAPTIATFTAAMVADRGRDWLAGQFYSAAPSPTSERTYSSW